ERAPGALEDRQQVAVLEQVRDLDGDVVAQPWPLRVERFDNRDGVARAVEKVGVAEGDVGGAGGDLPANVLQHNLALHDAEPAAVNRDHGAVAAMVLAAAGSFG